MAVLSGAVLRGEGHASMVGDRANRSESCDDDRVRTPFRSWVIITMLVAVFGGGLVAGCADGPPPIRRSSDTLPSTAQTSGTGSERATPGTNVFYPEQRNLSDCGPAAERPGCGSSAKGGWRMLMVFGVLMLGIVVVASRVVLAARRRSKVDVSSVGPWAHRTGRP